MYILVQHPSLYYTHISILYATNMLSTKVTRMWANAQCDGRPAEYRWRPLFNAAVWLMPSTRMPCSNTAKTRNLLRFAGVPQTRQKISVITGPSSPYCKNMWGRCCLTSFFPIVDMCLSCKDIARQSCTMVRRWRFSASCISTF